MAKRYDKTAFIAEYHKAHVAGETAEQLAERLNLPVNVIHSRAFYLRDGGLRLPRLRRTRKLAAKPVQRATTEPPSPTWGKRIKPIAP